MHPKTTKTMMMARGKRQRQLCMLNLITISYAFRWCLVVVVVLLFLSWTRLIFNREATMMAYFLLRVFSKPSFTGRNHPFLISVFLTTAMLLRSKCFHSSHRVFLQQLLCVVPDQTLRWWKEWNWSLNWSRLFKQCISFYLTIYVFPTKFQYSFYNTQSPEANPLFATPPPPSIVLSGIGWRQIKVWGYRRLSWDLARLPYNLNIIHLLWGTFGFKKSLSSNRPNTRHSWSRVDVLLWLGKLARTIFKCHF